MASPPPTTVEIGGEPVIHVTTADAIRPSQPATAPAVTGSAGLSPELVVAGAVGLGLLVLLLSRR